jgi:cytochrome c oxidase assembly protein subunit 15
MTANTAPATTSRPAPHALPGFDSITLWLIAVLVMVYVMVVLGGVTRLTQSGLSIVDWNPIMGVLPPLSDAAWQDAFISYKKFPEYQRINYGMTLAEFQAIYLMEWFHRLWGRLIGLAFALPLLWFALRGRLHGRFAWQLAGLLVLGGLQGLMGWIMVKSGLVDDPRVSPYRLAAHLMIAIIIFLALLWLVLERTLRPSGATALARPSAALLVFALVTVTSGAFVAGLDAGMSYNTFPLMDGMLVPEGLMMLEPKWRNFFENVATVQFDHRVLAISLVAGVCWFAVRATGSGLQGRAQAAVIAVLVMALIQMMLGIATLIMVVPVALGALHQAGALTLLGLLAWCVFESRSAA